MKNTTVTHFLSYLINYRFKHKTEKPRDIFMKVFFDNKGIESVNLARLLHKVTDAIPTSFGIKSVPTVLYTRSQTIGSQIFHYKREVQELKPNNWDPNDRTCECSKSKL